MKKSYFVIFFTILILLLAFILRIYKIDKLLMFVYDQATDAFEVQKILKGQLILLGPTTGIPVFLLGPFYYYLIAPAYWLAKGNPLGPIIFLIILDVIGILIAALFAKDKNNLPAFFICLILLCFSYGHISVSRWLSNPNPILWLAPLFFYLFYLSLSTKKLLYVRNIELIYILGFLFGLLWQTELANAIFFCPTIVFCLILLKRRFNIIKSIKFFSSFVVTLIPLIIFNLSHQMIMFTSFKNFFSNAGDKAPLLEVIKQRPIYYLKTLAFFMTSREEKFLLFLFLIIIIFLLYKKFWKDVKLTILFLWFFTPLFLMLFYTSNKGIIWNYYLVSQPIPFIILLSLALGCIIHKIKYGGYLFAIILISVIIFLNLLEWKTLVSESANMISYGNMKEAINIVYKEAKGQPFNVEIFVPNLLPTSYRYLFSWYGLNHYGYAPSPLYIREKKLFFIMEPGQEYYAGEQKWRNLWYKRQQHAGKIIKTAKIGDIDIEVRERLGL